MKLEELEKQYEELGKEIIKLRKIEKGQVDCWEELKEISGYFLDAFSRIAGITRAPAEAIQHNVCHTKEQVESQRAFAMLTQLRDRVRQGWKPDWESSAPKYTIYRYENKTYTDWSRGFCYFLTFETGEQRDTFLENHRELIETYFKGKE